MRRKIATWLLAFVLILPCAFMFTACAGSSDDEVNPKVTSLSVELISNDYTLTDGTITIAYGGKVELDDSNFKVTATLNNGETSVIEIATSNENGYTLSSTIPNTDITPVGEYKISFSHKDLETSIEIVVKVIKGTVDMSNVRWNYSENEPFAYDKSEKSVEIIGDLLPQGVSVEYQGVTRATNAGEYTATAIFTYSDSVNYNPIPNKVLNWKIEKADLDITSALFETFVYDGTEKTATLKQSYVDSLPEGVECSLSTGELESAATKATNAGTYKIVVSFECTGDNANNYNEIPDQYLTWEITPKEVEVQIEIAPASSSSKNFVYNAENQYASLNLVKFDNTLFKISNSTDVKTALTGLDAGQYKVYVRVESLNPNYKPSESLFTLVWQIDKAPLTITPKNVTVGYGENPSHNGFNYDGLLGNDTNDMAVQGNPVVEFVNYKPGCNAGTTYPITLSGLTSKNYNITYGQGTLTVVKAKFDFTNVGWPENNEYVYNGGIVKPVLINVPNGVEVEYTYFKGSKVEEMPMSVGNYLVVPTFNLEDNDNYEIINNTITKWEYNIIPAKIDLDKIVWDDEQSYIYSGESIKPTLNVSEIANTVISYTYKKVEGSALVDEENPVNVGDYVAVVSISLKDDVNFVLDDEGFNYSFNYSIAPAKLDCANVTWPTKDEFEYTGNAIVPAVENLPNGVLATYIYKIVDGSALIEIDEPKNVGEYIVEVTLQSESANYVLTNANVNTFSCKIIPATIKVVDGKWNVAATETWVTDNYKEFNSVIEYSEENPVEIYLVSVSEKFKVTYFLDWEEVDEICLDAVGTYYIRAELSLKDEYQQNYNFEGFAFGLNVEITNNPFDLIEINGTEVTFEDFANSMYFEYGSIYFELKEGYFAENAEGVEIDTITIGEDSAYLAVKNSEDELVFEKTTFNVYYFDQIKVGNEVVTNVEYENVKVELDKDQTTLQIEFDQKYLTKYNGKLNYLIYNEKTGSETNGQIEQTPFVVENMTEVSVIAIYLGEDIENSHLVLYVEVKQYSIFESITYSTVSFDNTGIQTENVLYSSISLYNQVMVDFNATLKEEYADYEVFYLTKYEHVDGQYYYSGLLDLTNINGVNNIYIVVCNENGDIVEVKEVYVGYNFSNDNYYFGGNSIYRVDSDEFDVTLNYLNTELEIASLANGEEVLTLTEDLTNVEYTLTIQWRDVVYTYSTDMVVIRTLEVSDCVSEESLNNGIYLIHSSKDNAYQIFDNSIDLTQYYTAANINEFKSDLDNVTFPVKDGYVVTEKELVAMDGNVFLKLTIMQDVVSASSLREINYLYILVYIQGSYDNDTSATIEVYETQNGYVEIEEDATTINVDISVQGGIWIQLNNNYANAYITDLSKEYVFVETESGYFECGTFYFSEKGTYYLVIVATDGTKKEYTINVTGETLPVLEIVVGNVTLAQEMGEYGPTEGDFIVEMASETKMSFTGFLGQNALSLVNQGKLTITSVKSSMLFGATLYDDQKVELTTTENFKLNVLEDSIGSYVVFYAEMTVEGVKAEVSIYLYLMDDPRTTPFKMLEVQWRDMVFTETVDLNTGLPSGDFEVQLINDTETSMEIMFITYLGEFDEVLETLTLNSIFCMYNGAMTDLMAQSTFTATENVNLVVGTNGSDNVPCVAYSIEFEPEENYTATYYIVLYLAEKGGYPAVITVGQNSYNFKLNVMSFDFGDVQLYDGGNQVCFYITVDEECQDLEYIAITLTQMYNDYSYMVLTGDACDNYVQAVEVQHVRNSNYIDALLQEGTNAFRVTTSEELIMQIPIQFVDGVAYFDIACEGFLGYLPEDSYYDLSFARVYILIDGIGEIPEENGSVIVNPNQPGNPGMNASMPEPEYNITVVSNDCTFSTENGTLIWDEYNYYFYAVLPSNVKFPVDNYMTINSCVITDSDGLDAELTMQGDIENINGNSERVELSFEEPVTLYMYGFSNSVVEYGCAGFIHVSDEAGFVHFQIAIVYDYENI